LGCIVKDVVEVIETLAPPSLAEDWDRIGLQVGDLENEIKAVLVGLDADLNTVRNAVQEGYDLLVTHHPLFYRPLSEIRFREPIGQLLRIALAGDLNIFSAHTNLDAAPEGINQVLARVLELNELQPLQTSTDPDGGMGRLGVLSEELTLTELVDRVKKALKVKHMRFVGDPTRKIRRLAVCGGSGAGLIGRAQSLGADCYITADIKYHDAMDARDQNLALIDPGHFSMEQIAIPWLAKYIEGEGSRRGWRLKVRGFEQAQDPFQFC